MNFKVISDGSCDLSDEIIKKYDVDVIPFYICTDNENYKKERVEIEVTSFYKMMLDNPNLFPKTSMPTTLDFIDAFTKYAKDNIPIIFVAITSKFSGSYNNACLAKQQVLEEYPNAKIEIIDSTANTCIQGLYVTEIAKMSMAGISYEKAIDIAQQMKHTMRIFFTIDGIEYLKHGGRIGKVAGTIGSVLGVKPLIVLKHGEIFTQGLTLSRKLSMKKVIANFLKYFKDKDLDFNNYEFVVGYGYDKKEGEVFREKVLDELPEQNIRLAQIGATIGVHTGPKPLGIGIVKKYTTYLEK